MVQVLCFSAEVTVETPVASRKKTSLGLVRTPLSAKCTSCNIFGIRGLPLSARRSNGAQGQRAKKEASDKSWLYNVQLKSKRPFYLFTDVVVGGEATAHVGM